MFCPTESDVLRSSQKMAGTPSRRGQRLRQIKVIHPPLKRNRVSFVSCSYRREPMRGVANLTLLSGHISHRRQYGLQYASRHTSLFSLRRGAAIKHSPAGRRVAPRASTPRSCMRKISLRATWMAAGDGTPLRIIVCSRSPHVHIAGAAPGTDLLE